MPPGFVISRKYLLPSYAKQEAGIASSIALGDHGFGELITPEEQFYLVAIGDGRSGITAELLQNELKVIAQEQQGKVGVAGFQI